MQFLNFELLFALWLTQNELKIELDNLTGRTAK